MKIKEILSKNKGFKEFLIKSIILIAFLIGIQFISLPFINNIIIPKEVLDFWS